MEVPQCEGRLSFLDNVATIELPPTPEGWKVFPSRQPFQVFFDSVLLVFMCPIVFQVVNFFKYSLIEYNYIVFMCPEMYEN